MSDTTTVTHIFRPRDLAIPQKGDLAIIRTAEKLPLYHLTRVAHVQGGNITALEQVNTGRAVPYKEWPRLDSVAFVAAEEVHACGVIAMAPRLTTPHLHEIVSVLGQHRRQNRPEFVPSWVAREAGFEPLWSVTLSHEAMVAAATWPPGSSDSPWVQGRRLLALVTTVHKVVTGKHPRQRVGADMFSFTLTAPNTATTTKLVAAVGTALYPSVAVGVQVL